MSEQRCISLFKEFKTLNDLKQIQAFAAKTGFQNDPFLFGKLLLSAITVAIDYAHLLFSHFPSPDAFMWNTLIRGFSQTQSAHQSILTYTQMRKNNVKPDSFSFAFLLKASANLQSLCSGTQLHCQALSHGFDSHLFVETTLVSMYAECGRISDARQVFNEMPQPNVVSWNAVITACFRCADLEGANELFGQMPWRNLTSWNIMLDGYMKTGELEFARKLFNEMPQRDLVSWNTMVVGFAQNGRFEESFHFFRELQVQGLRPNATSLTAVLSVCAQAGALEFGKNLHGFMEKSGLCTDVSVSNALLDMYAKCGIINMAILVFNQIEEKSIVSWTSMIAGLAMHGYGKEAVELFCKMQSSGTDPDGVTFISILYACSHSGLLETGIGYFRKMKEFYRIEPTIEHYGCMVDIYGRAGLLDQAYELIINMPIEPNSVIWRTLLGACSIHGNVNLAQLVKKKLSEIDPDNPGDHVLISNVYAGAGKWKEVAAVRRSMADQKLRKVPGWSMIEVDKVVYGFVVGDEEANNFTSEAYEKLKDIMLRLRIEGYVAEIGGVLHDIEEEEKEDSVSRHSEKLAVAFGMARLHKESIIRIVKNLRVCRDCHTVMKLISKVYEREIVVRDRSRFHLFKEGLCSCKDYW